MPVEKCYPTGGSTPLKIAGLVMVALGAVLLFVCVPGWAWLAIVSVGLIAAGLLLLKLSGVGR